MLHKNGACRYHASIEQQVIVHGAVHQTLPPVPAVSKLQSRQVRAMTGCQASLCQAKASGPNSNATGSEPICCTDCLTASNIDCICAGDDEVSSAHPGALTQPGDDRPPGFPISGQGTSGPNTNARVSEHISCADCLTASIISCNCAGDDEVSTAHPGALTHPGNDRPPGFSGASRGQGGQQHAQRGGKPTKQWVKDGKIYNYK